MEAFIYKLRFTSPLHVSSKGVGYESTDAVVHSDTLYSALCSVAAQLFDKDTFQSIFLSTEGEDQITLSSAFPYFKNTLFAPKPVGYAPAGFRDWEYEQQKNWKRVSYISWKALQALLQGKEITTADTDWSRQLRQRCFCLPAEDIGELYRMRETPRVTLDRISQASVLFFFADVIFDQDAGLYFLARFFSNSVREKFEIALDVLGDTGIGGDRTVGKGLFEVQGAKFVDLPKYEHQTNTHLMLSLYTPSVEEIPLLESQESYYEIVNRQGWVSERTLRRQTVRAFTEGSVLSLRNDQPPRGRLQEVLPATYTGFPVYRYLRAFSIPYKI